MKRTLIPLISSLLLAATPAFAGSAAAVKGATPAYPPERRVIEIHLNDNPHAGAMIAGAGQNLPAYFMNRAYALYVIEVLPGLNYTIGLSYPSSNRVVRVAVFDRLPYLPGAKRVALPGGPVVRTNSQKVEYRWRMGVSRMSTSPLLFISVEMNNSDKTNAPLSHTLFVMTPSENPMDSVGSGITRLEGPGEFVLGGGLEADVNYAVEKTRPAVAPFLLTLPIIGDLVRNGWFRDGLNDWQTHLNYEVAANAGAVSLRDDGLRIASSSGAEKEGVLQRIDADVSDADSLILRADVKIEKQAAGGTGRDGKTAPMAIAICYEDVEGKEHCKDDMQWTGFYSLAPVEPNKSVNGRKVTKGVWYRHTADVMKLEPRPKVIKYISIEGSGTPEREAWIRDVHLVKIWKDRTGPFK